MVENPKVSVCVVTYNQENYIRRCLQSIVDQETDFAFEVIVTDDASTDDTAKIVQEFADRYPEILSAVLQEKNLGPTHNYLYVHRLVRGTYVAHIDGDDYWLQGKLERLAEYLDENPDCRIVWHRMHILNEHGKSVIGMPVIPIRAFTGSNKLYLKDLAKYYGITGCHSGSMYRASARKEYVKDEDTLDYFHTLSFCVDGGYASYIDEAYGVYRYYSYENTMTKSKGGELVGQLKLSMLESYLASNPELAKEFSAQCLFEVLLRTYLRYPLKLAYLKMFLKCRSVPSITDLILIAKIFWFNRNQSLIQRYARNKEIISVSSSS